MDEIRKKPTDPDAFWDLSDLVPPRGRAPGRPAREPAAPVEISVPSARTTPLGVFGDVPLTERPVSTAPPPKPAEPLRVYRPAGSLLREVRIYPWQNAYAYYEQFRIHAERLAATEGTECPPVDFFSYMPQYSQLSKPQLGYYLWWRTCFRKGTCLPAAFSYLLLYLYELINLDETHQDPQTGRENMIRLWLSYRKTYPRLDALIREWLCDLCLLHQLPPPRLDPALYRTLLGGCRLKEFYVSADESHGAMTTAILQFCNNYDYTKSKFYRPDTAAEYDRVLGGAIGVALDLLRESDGHHLTDASGVSTVCRDTFAGAICAHHRKRRIEVDYTSFSHTHELRYVMTDVLKYAENALRQNKGIKSRLSIYAVSVPLRERLDAYLAAALPPKVSRSAPQEVPEYERRYDLPTCTVSFSRAAEIEADSWQTTKRLVEAFEAPPEEISPQTVAENAALAADPPPAPTPCEPAPSAPAQVLSPLAQSLGELTAFLPLCLAGDRNAQREFARTHGLMTDAVADRINTAAGELLGDVVLEEEGGAYVIVEDYLDYLKEQGVL